MSGMSKHYETPAAGKVNMFVVTDDRAWFLPFEDKATAPAFAEILVEAYSPLHSVRFLTDTLDGLLFLRLEGFYQMVVQQALPGPPPVGEGLHAAQALVTVLLRSGGNAGERIQRLQDLRREESCYPENMSFTKLDYCQYLLSSQVNYTLTNLAEDLKSFSHDTINRYLKGDKLTPRLLFEQVEPLLEPDPEAYLIFDDTVLDKSFGPKIEVARSQWSGNEKRVIRGIGVVSCVYVNPKPSSSG